MASKLFLNFSMEVMDAGGKNFLYRKIHFYRCIPRSAYSHYLPSICFSRIEYLLLDNLGFIYYLLSKK